VRAMIGLTVKDGQLRTNLPGSEIIKPLKLRIPTKSPGHTDLISPGIPR
jgi:hypothetical protein